MAISVGIHNINTTTIGTQSYTSPSGSTSQVSGSSFIVVASTSAGTLATVSDTVNGSSTGNTWTVPTPTSGTNPIQEVNDTPWLWLFLCTNGAGGVNHEVTVNAGTAHTVNCVNFIEIKGGASSNIIDKLASVYENSAQSSVSCPITLTGSGELALGFIMNGGHASNTYTPAGGFSSLDTYTTTDVNSLASCTKTGASGTVNPNIAVGFSGQDYVAMTIGLLQTSSAGGIPPIAAPFRIAHRWL